LLAARMFWAAQVFAGYLIHCARHSCPPPPDKESANSSKGGA
jgi:hypothetical protein